MDGWATRHVTKHKQGWCFILLWLYNQPLCNHMIHLSMFSIIDLLALVRSCYHLSACEVTMKGKGAIETYQTTTKSYA